MPEKSGTGILIGRFQVFELNEVHARLIDSVRAKHEVVHLFISSNPAPSDHNPLEWVFRAQMFEEDYGDALPLHEMPDLPDDRIWSQELDRRILELRPKGDVVIYGSDIDFVQRYSGRYETSVLEATDDDFPENTVGANVEHLRDFRAGVLYATMRRYPTVYPTVDIAVFRNDNREVLLARKENETKYRFPGGFTDPSDESFEMAAIRELMEECGEVEVEELTYLGSCKIDDWRYRGSMDSIMTHFYTCVITDGEPEPNDDISELRWFDVQKINADTFVHEHRPLFEMLVEYLADTV